MTVEQRRVYGIRPKYLILAAAIRDQILSGELAPGDKIPTVEQIRRETGMAPATIIKAVKVLHAEGRVEAFRGLGTFVTFPHEPN